MITKKIGFIGCGNMGGAILDGALKSGVLPKENVYVYDISPAIMEKVAAWGVNLVSNYDDLCQNSDIILLAVKPQYTPAVLKDCYHALAGKAILSIVAGITNERLRNMLPEDVRILRSLPNTPAMVSEGAFTLCSDTDFTPEELDAAKELHTSIGIVEMIPENLFDAACALNGGGPAFFAMFIEAMADGAVKQGVPRATAYRLAAQTALGTGKMLLETGMHPGQIKDMVTSPGGTTIEGCEALEKGGMRGAVMDCICKAAEKSRKL